MARPINIVIFGIGAMGTLFASFLSHKSPYIENELKYTLTIFDTWHEQITALRQKKLTVFHLDGTNTSYELSVTDNILDISAIDIAIILVKSHQTAKVAQLIASVLHPKGLVITLQNGIGNKEILTKVLGDNHVCLGITYHGATIITPGSIKHAGYGKTYIAYLPNLEEKLKKISLIFKKAGIETSLSENFDSLIWGKLAVNAAINPLTALLEIYNGKLLENTEYCQLMSAAAEEVALVAKAKNISLPYPDPVVHVKQVCKATATNRSSMLQDILRGSKTEIEVISGAVVKLGEETGIPTPVNKFLYTKIREKESGQKFDSTHLSSINNI